MDTANWYRKFKDMPYNSRQGLIILGLIIVLISIPVTISLIRQNPQFTSKAATATLPITFDGQVPPSTPLDFYLHPDFAKMDVQIHQRDPLTTVNDDTEQMIADHGTDCAGNANNNLFPTHIAPHFQDYVYICNNHIMTALNTTGGAGYGQIMLTPSQMCDISNGPCTITWDMSTHGTSTRNWVSVNISSFTDQLALWPAGPDIQPDSTIPGHWIEFSNEGALTGFSYKDDTGATASGCPFNPDGTCGWKADSKATRDTFQIVIDKNTVSLTKMTGEPNGQPLPLIVNQPHHLTATRLVVQFGTHDYTAHKGSCIQPSCPSPDGEYGTWHWDNFNLSPSVPFTVIHCGPKVISNPGGTVTCDAPAPANSFLRFPSTGQVTVNGQHVNPKVVTTHPELQNNYFVPIPQGTQTFQIGLACDSWYCNPLVAEDFAIWSTDTGGGGGTTCTKQADLNCDGLVNILDMSILLSKWNTTDATADINHDGKVSVFDLSILLSKWGS